MKKLLTANDRIRIAISLGGEFVSQLLGGDGSMNWYYQPWEVLNINNDAYKKAIYRLIHTGEIIKVVDQKKGVIYRMSANGESNFYRDYPLAELRKEPWDGLWRIVIYDLPIKLNYKRDRLRNKLIELGFGCYQKSVYATPLNVFTELREYLESQNLAESVVIFEANRLFGENTNLLAERLWGLGEINEKYFELEGKFKSWELGGKPKEEYVQLWDELSTILLRDPFLPAEFLPDNWVGERVKAKMFAPK